MSNTDALKALHTALIDAEKGYDEAVKDADAAEMKALFENMRSVHHQSHNEVHAILLSKGEQPDESGSFMSLVHKTVISVRSTVTGLDRPSLHSFASGEEHILSAYDAAIRENQSDAAAVDKLTQRKNRLVEMVARMKGRTA